MTNLDPSFRSLLVAALAMGIAACESGGPPTGPDPLEADLAQVANATVRYQDLSAALADGFIQASPCEAVAGQGAMGMHYVNPARVDGRIVLTEPELLLYIPEGGAHRLVAVEYFMPVVQGGRPYFGDAPPATGPAPTIFGRAMDGPMPGHTPTMPWHFDLHVWVFRHNPAGWFAQYNPDLRCP